MNLLKNLYILKNVIGDSVSEEPKTILDKFSEWVEKNLMPPMMKLVEEPHFAAVRDGLASAISLVIVGSMFLIIAFPPYEPWDAAVAPIRDLLLMPFSYLMGIYSLYVSMGVAYSLAKKKGIDPLQPTIVAVAMFLLTSVPMVSVATPEMTALNADYLGAVGLFTAIIISLISVEVFAYFEKKGLTVKLPPQVPPAIAQSFIALVPLTALTIVFWGLVGIAGVDLPDLIVGALSVIIVAADTLPAVLLAEGFHAFLWCFGVHGDMTIGTVLTPIWTINLLENAEAVANGLKPTHIYTDPFRSFYVVPGGSGATLPLAILCLRSKSKRLQAVGRAAIVPGIFNINEPITFGVPVFLNPIMWIPFITVTLWNAFFGYVMTAVGFASPAFATPPWTTPGPLGALLATGFSFGAFIVGVLNEFVWPFIIWYPFFKVWEKRLLKEEAAEAAPEES